MVWGQVRLGDVPRDEIGRLKVEVWDLRAEVEEMKLVVTTLVRLLAKKDFIDLEDIREVVKGIE